MARQVPPVPTGQVLLPDVPNWSWHEHGMRVGVWGFLTLYARLGIRPTLSINAQVCEDYRRVAEAARDAGMPLVPDGSDYRFWNFAGGHANNPLASTFESVVGEKVTGSNLYVRFRETAAQSEVVIR